MPLFTTFVYQPFLNVLVFFYWILELITGGNADMGVAVILLTIFIRILMLPLSLSGMKTEHERRKIADDVKQLEEKYAGEPATLEKEKKNLMRKNTGIVISETVVLIVQVMIALMLWRIFATGLSGEDTHLIYSFMPDVEQPFNLVFMGRFDLTHTSFLLNLIQSVLIFVLESLQMYLSPYNYSRSQVMKMQLVLPVVSFFIFMFLPAGKKLFIITTLCFSILMVSGRAIHKRFYEYKAKKEKQSELSGEQIVVDTK